MILVSFVEAALLVASFAAIMAGGSWVLPGIIGAIAGLGGTVFAVANIKATDKDYIDLQARKSAAEWTDKVKLEHAARNALRGVAGGA